MSTLQLAITTAYVSVQIPDYVPLTHKGHPSHAYGGKIRGGGLIFLSKVFHFKALHFFPFSEGKAKTKIIKKL